MSGNEPNVTQAANLPEPAASAASPGSGSPATTSNVKIATPEENAAANKIKRAFKTRNAREEVGMRYIKGGQAISALNKLSKNAAASKKQKEILSKLKFGVKPKLKYVFIKLYACILLFRRDFSNNPELKNILNDIIGNVNMENSNMLILKNALIKIHNVKKNNNVGTAAQLQQFLQAFFVDPDKQRGVYIADYLGDEITKEQLQTMLSEIALLDFKTASKVTKHLANSPTTLSKSITVNENVTNGLKIPTTNPLNNYRTETMSPKKPGNKPKPPRNQPQFISNPGKQPVIPP